MEWFQYTIFIDVVGSEFWTPACLQYRRRRIYLIAKDPSFHSKLKINCIEHFEHSQVPFGFQSRPILQTQQETMSSSKQSTGKRIRDVFFTNNVGDHNYWTCNCGKKEMGNRYGLQKFRYARTKRSSRRPRKNQA